MCAVGGRYFQAIKPGSNLRTCRKKERKGCGVDATIFDDYGKSLPFSPVE